MTDYLSGNLEAYRPGTALIRQVLDGVRNKNRRRRRSKW